MTRVARSEPYRGAGGERYRFHRGRYDHLQPPDRAGTDDGCESVGYGRYRFDRRRRNVVAGSCRNDPDARRAGGVEFGFRSLGSRRWWSYFRHRTGPV